MSLRIRCRWVLHPLCLPPVSVSFLRFYAFIFFPDLGSSRFQVVFFFRNWYSLRPCSLVSGYFALPPGPRETRGRDVELMHSAHPRFSLCPCFVFLSWSALVSSRFRFFFFTFCDSFWSCTFASIWLGLGGITVGCVRILHLATRSWLVLLRVVSHMWGVIVSCLLT